MKTRKFSLNDAVVLKENDKFDNAMLSNIMGGSSNAGCTCKCDSGNCYKDNNGSTILVPVTVNILPVEVPIQ